MRRTQRSQLWLAATTVVVPYESTSLYGRSSLGKYVAPIAVNHWLVATVLRGQGFFFAPTHDSQAIWKGKKMSKIIFARQKKCNGETEKKSVCWYMEKQRRK